MTDIANSASEHGISGRRTADRASAVYIKNTAIIAFVDKAFIKCHSRSAALRPLPAHRPNLAMGPVIVSIRGTPGSLAVPEKR